MGNCPVCQFAASVSEFDHKERLRVSCARCGDFVITWKAANRAQNNTIVGELWRSILSYWIQKRQATQKGIEVGAQLLDLILQEIKLPRPKEQADNLIRWIGENLKSPEELINIAPQIVASQIGTTNEEGVDYIASHLKRYDYVRYISQGEKPIQQDMTISLGLTFKGWDEYEALKRGRSTGRIAFMAMQFNNPKYDGIYKNCFKRAVEETGFELRRLDEILAAGLIDNQLRIEIRKARFILADLSSDNNGAYWEAGYAEGLGKPVIYLCERLKFDNFKTHFDTNHHTTVIWDENELASATERLKATIRATLPLEAKMLDN